jgi:hypothetical protein
VSPQRVLTTFMPSPDIRNLQSAIGGQCLGLEAILEAAQVAISRNSDVHLYDDKR